MESDHSAAPSAADGIDTTMVAYIMHAESALPRFLKIGDTWVLPERVRFRNASYDASSRTSVGTIERLREWGNTCMDMNR
jgi:hypothetical protein